jgi:hypothetical protein
MKRAREPGFAPDTVVAVAVTTFPAARDVRGNGRKAK